MPSSKKQLSVTQRNLVVDLVKQRNSYRDIQKLTGIAVPTIQKIIKKFKTFGTTNDLSGRGRKRKTSKKIDRVIAGMISKDRFQSSRIVAEKLKKENKYHNIELSPELVRLRIHEAGFNARVVRKKPYLTSLHRKRRLEFAKTYVNMPLSYWKKILWSDESKFNLKASDGKPKVWRKPGEAFKLSCTRATVKHGGGNIMVWGCMAWNGVGNLQFIDSKMNSVLYIDILKKNLKSSVRKLRLGNNFIFMQDNDPKHRSKA